MLWVQYLLLVALLIDTKPWVKRHLFSWYPQLSTRHTYTRKQPMLLSGRHRLHSTSTEESGQKAYTAYLHWRGDAGLPLPIVV